MSFEKDGIKQVDKEELEGLIDSKLNEVVIIDVREPEEYESGHIPGIPLLPMRSIPLLVDGFAREKEYVFVCRSGNRSQQVSLYLKQLGLKNVTNFAGGMLSWDKEKRTGSEYYIKDVDDLKAWNE